MIAFIILPLKHYEKIFVKCYVFLLYPGIETSIKNILICCLLKKMTLYTHIKSAYEFRGSCSMNH